MSELAETATAEAAAPPRPDLPPEVLYLNRELSMLAYMERVLGLAEDPARPLLERVAFLAMSCDAVDDFFQIRVAGLKEQQESPQALTSPDGLTPARQLRAIRGRVEGIVERHTRLYVEDLKPELREAGIVICDASQLSDEDRRHLTAEFRERIFPVLTPLAVDPGHPFPYISNLSLNLAAVVRDLGIPFPTPYERVLDASDGPEWARWFIGGRLNIAHACAEDPNAIGAGGVEYQDFVARRLMAIGDGGQFGDI